MDIYFLWSNQDVQKVLSTCLANTKYSYTGHSIKPDVSAPPPFLCLNFHKFVRLFFTIFYQGNFMVKNELPNLLASQEMNYPTHFSSVPTRGINSELSLMPFCLHINSL